MIVCCSGAAVALMMCSNDTISRTGQRDRTNRHPAAYALAILVRQQRRQRFTKEAVAKANEKANQAKQDLDNRNPADAKPDQKEAIKNLKHHAE